MVKDTLVDYCHVTLEGTDVKLSNTENGKALILELDMKLKNIFFACLVTATLSAQLVEKPTAPTKSAAKTSGKPSTSSASKPKESPKDLLDLIKAPKEFRGALVDKATDRALLIFRGSWIPAPVISGGGTTTQWSSRAALLSDLDERGSGAFQLGFNMGRKDGQLMARLFQRSSSTQKQVVGQDEGTVKELDGVYTMEFEKSTLFLWPANVQVWEPKQASLFRYIVNGCNAPGQIQPRYSSPSFPGRTQRGLTFGGGSYLVIEDGPIGRIFFAPFGDANLQSIRFVRRGDKIHLDTARRPGVPEGKHEGFGYFSHIWGDGLTGFGLDDSTASARSIVTFRFRKGLNLDEFASVSDNPLFSFTLSVAVEEIPLQDSVKTEVIDRAKDLGWPLSGGPYSLKRTLLRAFEGCTIQPPSLSRDDVRQSGMADLRSGKNTSGPAYIKWGHDLYPVKLAEWAETAKEAGATFLGGQPARPNTQTGPMGRIYPPGITPESVTSTPSGKKPSKSLFDAFKKPGQ